MIDGAPCGLDAHQLACPTAHQDPAPVRAMSGELVAWLCVTCDHQLPADWERPEPHEHREVSDVTVAGTTTWIECIQEDQ